MGTRPDRWEHGSEFHWASFPPEPRAGVYPWRAGLLLGSGRDALRLLVAHGRERRGWRRVLVPSYFCQEVVRAMAALGPELAVYPDSPLERIPVLPPLRRGDALLHVGYFGLRSGPSLELPAGVDLVEDHTHDPTSPWAGTSRADFCVASLRKTLPIPDGGALWSPRGHSLPSCPPGTPERARASSDKLAAMVLKALYLGGHPVDKEAFRRLAVSGETDIAAGPPAAMPEVTHTLLGAFPADTWRTRRRENHGFIRASLHGIPWLEVLSPASDDCVAFTALLVCDSPARRERVRHSLIEERIYPAVLWPLDETLFPVPDNNRELSRRVLSLHCDFRYTRQDLERVAALVAKAGEE